MLNAIDKNLLKEVADLETIPKGAYNIRKNGELLGREISANINIETNEKKRYHHHHQTRDGEGICPYPGNTLPRPGSMMWSTTRSSWEKIQTSQSLPVAGFTAAVTRLKDTPAYMNSRLNPELESNM